LPISLAGASQEIKKRVAGEAKIANAVRRGQGGDVGQDATAAKGREERMSWQCLVVERVLLYG